MSRRRVTLNYPDLVRRLVLAGTGPGGGEGIVLAGPEMRQVSGRPILGLEETLFLLFSPSEESLAAAHRYWDRVNSRPDREPAVSETTIKAQVTAAHRMVARGRLGVSAPWRNQTAGLGREREQRRHGADDQLLHHGAEDQERRADCLSGLRPRLLVPVSGDVQPARPGVLEMEINKRTLAGFFTVDQEKP